MFCQKCGNKLDVNAKFCNKCGSKTETSEPMIVTPQAAQPQHQVPHTSTQVIGSGATPGSKYLKTTGIIITILMIANIFYIPFLNDMRIQLIGYELTTIHWMLALTYIGSCLYGGIIAIKYRDMIEKAKHLRDWGLWMIADVFITWVAILGLHSIPSLIVMSLICIFYIKGANKNMNVT